ncbi:MAG: hypothetical protein KC589_03520 [Nanoarchaeota archaeon]|nr:hypothetical protein [Nanoarchaeota archaeon]
MKKEKYMSWDTYFMSIALLSSFRSKDRYTQNGACIVDFDKKIVGIGYNGLPRGIDDNDDFFWKDDDDSIIESRHTYVVHAEKNAIYNSISRDLNRCTIYVTQFPCNVCAQAIIQVGIKKVVYLHKKVGTDEHIERNGAVENMFDKTGVEVYSFTELDIDDPDFVESLRALNGFYD